MTRTGKRYNESLLAFLPFSFFLFFISSPLPSRSSGRNRIRVPDTTTIADYIVRDVFVSSTISGGPRCANYFFLLFGFSSRFSPPPRFTLRHTLTANANGHLPRATTSRSHVSAHVNRRRWAKS